MLAPPWPIPAAAYGGVEAVVDGLCRALHDNGVEVRLWAAVNSTCPVTRSGVIDSRGVESKDFLSSEVVHLVDGFRWFAAERVDVIHDHTMAGSLVGAALATCPIVATNHLLFDRGAQQVVYNAVADRVSLVAISRSQASGASFPVRRIIHHGTDIEDCPVGDGKGYDRGRFAVFLGRMAPEKGVHLAAHACKAAGLPLKIVARMEEPQEFAYFDAVVKPLLDETVEFLGELCLAERRCLLGAAAVLINPIVWPEPFGLVMIEALACGTPVLAMDAGAAPEIVEHGRTGWICETTSELPQRLAEIDEIDRRACRMSVELKFSLARMASDYIDLYREIVGS